MLKLRLAALIAALLLPLSAKAEVIRFEVTRSEPAFEGRSFGSVGTYVKVTGRAVIAVDPASGLFVIGLYWKNPNRKSPSSDELNVLVTPAARL